jgi:hypothetical protein
MELCILCFARLFGRRTKQGSQVFEYRSRSRVAVGMEAPAFCGKTVLTMVMRAEHPVDIHI